MDQSEEYEDEISDNEDDINIILNPISNINFNAPLLTYDPQEEFWLHYSIKKNNPYFGANNPNYLNNMDHTDADW